MSLDTAGLPSLVVIAGATAVGKTHLALDLAQRHDGEIVNADSRCFYRGMDIGTAKPTPAERQQVPHHLIDFIDPGAEMSLAHFQALAFTAINDVLHRGRVPFLVGGSAQYLNAVVENWRIPEVAPDEPFRRAIEERVAQEGVGPLLEELQRLDPVSAVRTGPNPRRIIRALEVHHATGRPMSSLIAHRSPRYRTLQFELWLPREELHERIARRAEAMLDAGLIEEMRQLLASGVPESAPALSSIGYRDALPYLRGEATREEVAASIRHNSNRLVRHQQTWFRKNAAYQRIDMRDPVAATQVCAELDRFLQSPT